MCSFGKYFLLFIVAALGEYSMAAVAFELRSSSIAPNGTIGRKYVSNDFGCNGQNLSPSLEWLDPPAGTKSYAIMVHDPDAPTGGAGFWHWAIVNIPPSVISLSEGIETSLDKPMVGSGFWHWVTVNIGDWIVSNTPANLASFLEGFQPYQKENKSPFSFVPPPKGSWQLSNDYGYVGWGGPCPPPGSAPHHYYFTVYALKVEKLPVTINTSTSMAGFMVTSNSIGSASLVATYSR